MMHCRFDFRRFHQRAPHAAPRATGTSFTSATASRSLIEKCQFYLANGLAPSTRQVYTSAQCKVLEFCNQDVPSIHSQL